MVVKVRKNSSGQEFRYRSSKNILTPADLQAAERFDSELNETIRRIERMLLKNKALSSKNAKKDPLRGWWIIGKNINSFLKKWPVAPEEERYFWEYLYGRSALIPGTATRKKTSLTRNNFKIASLLARFNLNSLKSVGPWTMWREILAYKNFINEDQRLLQLIIHKLSRIKPSRDSTRPFLKSAAERFKRIDTTVLSDKELNKKFNSADDSSLRTAIK